MEGLEIRQLTKEGIKDVKYLIETVYDRKYSLEYLENKYNTGVYCDYEYVATLGYFNNEPIAFYGALPIIFKDGNKEILGVQTCDSFTKKEYQGNGIHYKLANACYEGIKSLGAEFVFAFHSDNTFHSCKKLGWEIHEQKQRFQIKTGVTMPFFKVLSKFSFLDKFKQKRIDKALNTYIKHKTFDNVYNEEYLSVYYSDDFVTYKNFLNNRIIEIAGCKIWLKFDFVLLVGAFSNLSEGNVQEVLEGLKRIGKKLKINEILIQLDRRTKEYELVSRYHKSEKSFLIGYYLFNPEIDFTRARINYIDFDTFL